MDKDDSQTTLDLIAEKLAGVLRGHYQKVKFVTRANAIYLDAEVADQDQANPFPKPSARIELTLTITLTSAEISNGR